MGTISTKPLNVGRGRPVYCVYTAQYTALFYVLGFIFRRFEITPRVPFSRDHPTSLTVYPFQRVTLRALHLGACTVYECRHDADVCLSPCPGSWSHLFADLRRAEKLTGAVPAEDLEIKERPQQESCARRSSWSLAPSCPKQGRRPPPC